MLRKQKTIVYMYVCRKIISMSMLKKKTTCMLKFSGFCLKNTLDVHKKVKYQNNFNLHFFKQWGLFLTLSYVLAPNMFFLYSLLFYSAHSTSHTYHQSQTRQRALNNFISTMPTEWHWFLQNDIGYYCLLFKFNSIAFSCCLNFTPKKI